LEQKLRKRYVGVSEDVLMRLRSHNSRGNRFTSGGIPWVLIYKEYFDTRKEALIREKFLKSGAGRSWLDKNVK
jgi:putative endonuclease